MPATISSLTELEALYDQPAEASLLKETDRIIPEYRARRDALDEALRKALPSEIKWQRPAHGIVFWVPLPGWLEPDAVYEEALKAGVLVSPSPMWNVGGGEGGIRLAFCAEPAERLVLGAKRLGKAIKALSDRAPKKSEVRSVVEIV